MKDIDHKKLERKPYNGGHARHARTIDRTLLTPDEWREYRQKYMARWRSRNRVRQRELSRRDYLAHPIKSKARRLLNNAIQSGRIKRQSCEICGEQRTHAHHDNYRKPYDVRWLCIRHHAEHHAHRIAVTEKDYSPNSLFSHLLQPS